MKLFLVFATIISSGLCIKYKPAPFNWTLLSLDEWWGPEELKANPDTSIRSAKIEFSDEMVQDLKQRLIRHNAFNPPLNDVAFEYGFNSDAIGYWISYWAESYDFKERENYMNQFPQYKTNIQGIDIHFIWIKPEAPEGKTRIPLLLLHGWGGSIREFYDSIPMLTAVDDKRDFVVDLVMPCLPGFGYSGTAVRKGLGAAQIAIVLRNFMQRLGYQKFYIQGGDWGSFIGSHMATLFSEEILGYHTNWAFVQSIPALGLHLLGAISSSLVVEPEYANRMYPLSTLLSGVLEESAFIHLKATKPETIGIALTDSPAGFLACLLEKFSTTVDPDNRQLRDGGLNQTFTPNQLIDNIMMYWGPKSITPSMRIYAESYSIAQFSLGLYNIPTPVPTMALQSLHELAFQSTTILNLKYPNLLGQTVLDYGGHFFAFQYPKEFSEHVLGSLEQFIEWNKNNQIGN